MPIALHIEAESLADLVAKANVALSGFAIAVTSAAATSASEALLTPADAPKATRRQTKAPEATESAASAAEPKIDETPAELQPEVEPPPADLDYEAHIKPAVLELAQSKGRDVVVALLSDWKVDRASDLKADQYAEFYADVAKRKAA